MSVLGFVKYVSEASDNDKLTLGVLMDLSKAFDTTDHNILFDKLYHLFLLHGLQITFKIEDNMFTIITQLRLMKK